MARICPHCWMCPGGRCGVDDAAEAGGHPGPPGPSHASLHHLSPSHGRTQPASASDPVPYPQIWVLDQCELLSWLWKTTARITTPWAKEEGGRALHFPPRVLVHLCRSCGNLGKALLRVKPSADPHLISTLVFMRCVLLCCCSQAM